MRGANATLDIRYTVRGRIDHLVIPAEGTPSRADRLWQHTCFEAFVAGSSSAGDTGYWELNFSPSKQWAIYRFSAYRAGMTMMEAGAPAISVRSDATSLTLESVFALQTIIASRGQLRLALCAVLEETQQRLSYWAPVHRLDKPDFHDAAGFTLRLPRAANRELAPSASSARTRIGAKKSK